MRQVFVLLALAIILCAGIYAQKPAEILATTSIRNFTVADLPEETQKAWTGREQAIANARKQLVSQLLNELLVAREAAALRVSPESLISAQKEKVADPTEQQIKAVYDANREALANSSPDEARKQIIKFLRQPGEQSAMKAYTDSLAAKYKVANGKDINMPGLLPSDVIFSIGSQPTTEKEFEDRYKLALYDLKADVYDEVLSGLEDAIYSALVAEEAKAAGVDAQTLLAREITSKLREFSDEERFAVQDAFHSKLYGKYKVKVLISEPPPVVQNISTDDDPSRGPVSAPVTVVMFSDFQCPACSATHPVLAKVLSEYGDKVRFVVRDFPLSSIHENALQAAKAAGAANLQGKFFEYIELLYTHQDALDRESLKKYAANIGLNVKQFELDLSGEKTAAEVQKDIADGRSYGIYSTPSIFVNGVLVRRLSVNEFRAAIDAALKK